MEQQIVKITLGIDSSLYLKDPNSSEMGRNIISQSIVLIDKMGFEAFTFKKLADYIGATEPTIYRYFENKYKLLNYLVAWYWNWMEYKLNMAWANLDQPHEKLKIAIGLLSQTIEKDPVFEFVDEKILYRLVVAESSKVYLLKDVDTINKAGHYIGYKRITKKVASVLSEINPSYSYPRALISTVIEASHSQRFFAEHLPSLTEINPMNPEGNTTFLYDLVLRVIAPAK